MLMATNNRVEALRSRPARRRMLAARSFLSVVSGPVITNKDLSGSTQEQLTRQLASRLSERDPLLVDSDVKGRNYVLTKRVERAGPNGEGRMPIFP